MTTAEQAMTWKGAEPLREHLVPIDELKPFPGNPRRGDIPMLMKSLERFGQVRAVLVLADKTIIAGHHVTRAARNLGWTHVAAIPAEFGNRDNARDYLIADNQLGSLGHTEKKEQLTFLEEAAQRGTLEGTGFTVDDLADMRALQVHKSELVEAAELKRHFRNYREHPEDQIEHLVASLREHGIYRNIVVARDGTILAGHGIFEAARRVGLSKIPVTRLDLHPEDPEALKILAGDNELDKLGEIDDRQLTEILRRVKDEGDVEALLGTGYDARTLASLVLVTRHEYEIPNQKAAAEWLGLPEFDAPEDKVQLILTCDSEDDRTELIKKLGLFIANKNRQAWACRYPPRRREDLSSLRFDFGDEAAEGVEQADGPTE